ncbi:cysteine desulfurase [Collinsella sp. AGMB00827]|uniref:cysteine desulfurase n=1 Tax=Collinsella ureilytica TaxID=2869515 RepID=A0ABS7MKD7_9ACTN|nr:cysteine desulfurase family protein [Collinsella urealyticum]MBY4797831.1 cysteine desulfurase [Collinsella urealyticum]
MTSSGADTSYIYADNAATTPLSQKARAAMMPYLTENFENPSGIHRISREAAQALTDYRGRIAAQLDARPGEIYFTSGGSESDTWVLRGAVQRMLDRMHAHSVSGWPLRPCIITSAIEHHAILRTCDALAAEGVEIIRLPVNEMGAVSETALESALDQAENRVALVSIMLANNEIGTIQDIPRLAALTHERGIPFHTDAVQALGHIPVSVAQLGVDALSLSAHKFHGPQGIGALYLKEGFSIPPLIFGGEQERGRRAGTENLAGIAGMATALEEATEALEHKMSRLHTLREQLTAAITAVDGVQATGDTYRSRRLPGLASFICHDVDGELLTVMLDRAGIAAATGSACSTGSTEASHVILALGYDDPRWNRGSLRLSLADDVTDEEVDTLCTQVPACIVRCRTMSGLQTTFAL